MSEADASPVEMANAAVEESAEEQELPIQLGPVQEHLFKVLVVGDFGVGKTSIIRRYIDGYFTSNYKLTLGVDFALKTVEFNRDTRINLQLWDIAGHERFGHMTRVYYKYAIAAIIVYDITRSATFSAVKRWLNDLQSKVMTPDGDRIPIILLANKCDLKTSTTHNLDTLKLNDFCLQNNIICWFPTSAKDNLNIEESIDFLLGHILVTKGAMLNSVPSLQRSGSSFSLDGAKDNNQSSCCFGSR